MRLVRPGIFYRFQLIRVSNEIIIQLFITRFSLNGIMQCPECKKEFVGNTWNQKFCSARCRNNFNQREWGRKHRDAVNQRARDYRNQHIEELRKKWRKYPPVDQLNKECRVCGKSFKPGNKFHPFQKYCSRACAIVATKKFKVYERDLDNSKLNDCVECGRSFHPARWHPKQRFCNKTCQSRFSARKNPKMEERKEEFCAVCGKGYIPSRFQPRWQRYCSRKCREKAVYTTYYLKHYDRVLEKVRRYNQTEMGKLSHRASARRIGYLKRSKNPIFEFNRKMQNLVMSRDGEKCVYCDSTKNLTFDHIISQNKGGTDSILNIVVCCHRCNSSKQKADVFQWCKKMGRDVPEIVIELLKKQKTQKTLPTSSL